jgi:hypothetical protein
LRIQSQHLVDLVLRQMSVGTVGGDHEARRQLDLVEQFVVL